MKKVLFSAVLLMAAATVSFAGNPNGENKSEAKTEVPAENATQSTQYAVLNVTSSGSVNYYIVGPVTGNEPCGDGTKACLITTSSTPDGQNRIPQNEATIDDFRVSYP